MCHIPSNDWRVLVILGCIQVSHGDSALPSVSFAALDLNPYSVFGYSIKIYVPYGWLCLSGYCCKPGHLTHFECDQTWNYLENWCCGAISWVVWIDACSKIAFVCIDGWCFFSIVAPCQLQLGVESFDPKLAYFANITCIVVAGIETTAMLAWVQRNG